MLSKRSEKRSRLAYIGEAGFEHFISLFVTSTFLTYLMIDLGISDAWMGVIANIAAIANALQLLALCIRRTKVKRLVTVLHTVNQLAFASLYLLPLSSSLSPNLKTALFVLLLTVGYFISAAISPIKLNWMMEAVPDRMRGSFTAVKEMISLFGGMIISLGLGRLADHYKASGDLRTYWLIGSIAMIALALIHTVTLLLVDESAAVEQSKEPIAKRVRAILTNKTLIKVIAVGALWSVASSISASFFAVYAQKELAFTLTMLTLFGIVASLARILVSPILGRLADKTSFALSMLLCFAIMTVAFLFMVFTAPGASRWAYLGYTILHAVAMGGINSGAMNLIFDYVTPEQRTAALGIKNAISGFLAFFVSFLGGRILAAIQANGGLSLFGIRLYAQQFLALLSVVIILLLMFYIKVVVFPLRRNGRDDA